MPTTTAPTVDDLQAALDLAVTERRAAKASGDKRRITLADRAWSYALGAVCTARRDAEVAAKANRHYPDAKPVPTFHHNTHR